ncbi:MAG: Arm DNA-binding domain-containing protein, partial [Croceibacterium sp.]
MAKRHLTDAAVERIARPTHSRIEVSDTEPGLFLRVTLTGVKSWMVIYRLPSIEGKRTERRRTVVGRFPDVGVAVARDRARQLMRLAREGIDPELVRASEIASAKTKAAEERANNFEAIASDYIAAMLAGQLIGGRKRAVTEVTAIARQRLLQARVFPRIGSLPIASITTPQIAHLLAEIETQKGPVDETLKVIRGVFKFALSRGRFTGSLPTAGMTSRQPPKKVTRSLLDSELRGIWNAAGQQGWPFGSIT